MHYSTTGLIALLSLLSPLASAATISESTEVVTKTEAVPYMSSYPICGARGLTEEPGDNDMGALEGKNLTLHECRVACRQNGTCKSVSYAKNYDLCSFYSEPMQCDQLYKDKTSNFVHFDNACSMK